jgi:hypothetical protein
MQNGRTQGVGYDTIGARRVPPAGAKGRPADLVQPAAEDPGPDQEGSERKDRADLELLRFFFAVIRELESFRIREQSARFVDLTEEQQDNVIGQFLGNVTRTRLVASWPET